MMVTVATQRQVPTRTIASTEVRFIKIAARKFSGFKTYTIYGRNAAITDLEKTVIDCIDRPDLSGGPAEVTRIVYSAMGEIDRFQRRHHAGEDGLRPARTLSADLDFTCRTDISVDDLMLEAVHRRYHGISFLFDRDKDWYLTDDGCAANPACAHVDNERDVKIKIAGQHARAARSTVRCRRWLWIISICWNLPRLRFPVSPSRK